MRDTDMPRSSSLTSLAVLIGISGLSYGLGTGWVRFGPPGPPPSASPPPAVAEPPPSAAAAARRPPAAPVDAGLRRTRGEAAEAAGVPAPLAVAAGAVGAVIDPEAILRRQDVRDAIDEATDPVTNAFVQTLLANDKTKTAVKAAALRAFDPQDATAKLNDAAATAAKAPSQRAVGAVLRLLARAAVTGPGTAPANDTDAAELAITAVRNAAKAAEKGDVTALAPSIKLESALQAALDAVDAKGPTLAFVRSDFADNEIALAYLDGASPVKVLPINGPFTAAGPTLTVRATVTIKAEETDPNKTARRFNDTGATVTAELAAAGSDLPPFLPLAKATKVSVDPGNGSNTVDFDLTVAESGQYNVVVTLTPVGRPPFTRSVPFVVQPTSREAPRATTITQNREGRNATFTLDPTANPVDLRGGAFQLTVALGQTDGLKRDLLLIDADRATAVFRPDGGALVNEVTEKGNAATNAPLNIEIDPRVLEDRPTRMAVVDLWSRQRSDTFTVTINTGGLPPEGPGVSGRTGPNAVFPEYTTPRTIPDGFKPSDKVETRVVRLYYYRDAHRVAQIVNRDVRSWNRVAVDTRRRMAERARKEADALTDTRALQEVRGVQSAQATRQAEARFRQAQTDLDAALQRERQAAQDAPVLDAQLRTSEDLVTQAEANVSAAAARVNGIDRQKDPDAFVKAQAELAEAMSRRGGLVAQQSQLRQRRDAAQALTGATKPSDTLRLKVDDARQALETLRAGESATAVETLRDQQLEDRARENQFRQEVAAAHEDPDTYAPGVPGSPDPVLQVSVSVIGEGEIQLRGPIKGINVIRTMINQIDAPVGQVRVGVHTIQINGERGDRMEKVATRIQDYVDHARFLTAQSGQLLRNAVVKVASRKAVEAAAACDAAGATTQQARDAKYQEAFFGHDFINELREIDSEFLMSGNKLLSLHSMDTTSLASALFLLALAKNDTRMEILAEFQRSLQFELPQAEARYYQAGAVGRAKDHHREFQMLACNARFQSLFGFFNADVAGSETLNPLQREFTKLAQIFKSRLVTELEFNQRVKERGLIEDRIDPIEDRKAATAQEKEALDKRAKAFELLLTQRTDALARLAASDEKLRESEDRVTRIIASVDDRIRYEGSQDLPPSLSFGSNPNAAEAGRRRTGKPGVLFRLPERGKSVYLPTEAPAKAAPAPGIAPVDAADKGPDPDIVAVQQALRVLIASELEQIDTLFNFYFSDMDYRELAAVQKRIREYTDQLSRPQEPSTLGQISDDLKKKLEIIKRVARTVRANIQSIERSGQALTGLLSAEVPDARQIYQAWLAVRETVRRTLRSGREFSRSAEQQIVALDQSFQAILQAFLDYETQTRIAEFRRRPLDHKRLLDMLIDDVEDKYIELLEGTRSHTANIDGYIKNIATALDDDFNTQFYYPAFTEIRRASRYWDVSLGKVESTNVLANNRSFAKVEPQATMEFDLPKRDILINEAMNGALAMTKDFGALVNDPTFLAMAQLRSGQPTSSLEPGASVGVGSVRNVLPGLSRANDEKLLSQQGPGRTGFGSAMEALIPDPAVYKFETGTGFEIRPVLQPDGQAVVFHFNYMYTTNVREPVRADEKHLGRVKRHFIDTDVQLSNYELREVSRYQVGLKAARTSRGVPLFEDIPGLGILFRPLPSAESSLQENIVLAQSTIFPTLFDLMGLRWAPAVADLDTLRLRNDNFVVRGRARDVANHVFDISAASVDEFLRIPPAERRSDLYRTQTTIPDVHPDGYRGPGLNLRDSWLREGYNPTDANPETPYVPGESRGAVIPGPGEGGADVPSGPGVPSATTSARVPRPEAAPRVAARPGPAPAASRPAPPVTRPPARPAAPVALPPLPPSAGVGPTTSRAPAPAAAVRDQAVLRASATAAAPAKRMAPPADPAPAKRSAVSRWLGRGR